MNLKGYNFYNDAGKVRACFRLKDLTLILYEQISASQLLEIRDTVQQQGFEIQDIIKEY